MDFPDNIYDDLTSKEIQGEWPKSYNPSIKCAKCGEWHFSHNVRLLEKKEGNMFICYLCEKEGLKELFECLRPE